MLGEEDDDDDEQTFTRRASFTEKSKERLEIYRRRSLPQNPDDGKIKTIHFIVHIHFIMSMKVKEA